MKLISVNNLYNETGWEPLEQRYKHHIATLFFKMTNNLSLPYLSSLVPQTSFFQFFTLWGCISLNLLLYGDASLPCATNAIIFQEVQK